MRTVIEYHYRDGTAKRETVNHDWYIQEQIKEWNKVNGVKCDSFLYKLVRRCSPTRIEVYQEE